VVRTRWALTTSLKDKTITLGLYKPARWLIDNVVDRERLTAHATRLALYRELLKPDALCYDVGAYIGDYTETLACAAAKVIAIEPQPSCIRELRARFRGDERITIVPIALGAENGSSELFLRENRRNSSLIEKWNNREVIGSVTVPVKTLDEMIKAYGLPDYIKMDVEGFELQVIRGLSKKIRLMSFEYHLSLLEDCAEKLELVDLMSRFGRLQFNILPDGARNFYWSEFASLKKFVDTFPKKLGGDVPFGDIFMMTS